MDKDIRWKQRFSNYQKALGRLSEIVENSDIDELSELEKEGLIQRFEYTYELAWKTLKDYIIEQGYTDVSGPTSVLMQSFTDGYIADAEGWRRMKKSREMTSHTYNSETADGIINSIFDEYHNLLKLLEKYLKTKQEKTQNNLFE